MISVILGTSAINVNGINVSGINVNDCHGGRRQIYNEMKEAAERNRRAVRGDYGMAEPSGPAAAPAKAPWEGPLDGPQVSPPLSREPSPSARQPSGGAGVVDPSAEERWGCSNAWVML